MDIQVFPGQTLGILGGGKTASFLSLRAKEMGYFVGVLVKDANEPAAKVADWFIEGAYDRTESILALAEKSDVLILATEEIDLEILSELQPYIKLPQLVENLSITNDRLIEKVFLESLNINVSPYATITTIEDIEEAIQSIGFPCVLKPIRIELSQLENVYLYSEDDYAKAKRLLATGACVLESFIPLNKEMAVTLVVKEGQTLTHFPITETIYQNGKLKRTITPAQVEEGMLDAIAEVAKEIAAAMQVTGLLTIELFVTNVGAIYVKQLLVNAQNVADFTLDACSLSQYEALIRVVCGLPLPEQVNMQPTITHYLEAEKLEQAIFELPNHPEWVIRYYDREKKIGQITQFSEEVAPFFAND